MEIKKPISIIGAPRSGTSLLFHIFTSHPDLWSLYGESERIIRRYFHPQKTGWSRGNELREEDASDEIIESLRTDFYRGVYNCQVVFKNSCSFIQFREKKQL